MGSTNRIDLSHHYAMTNIPLISTENIRRKVLDIPYASLSPSQKLDIYFPDEGKAPFPTIMAIHGGAFMCGDKADIQLLPMLEGLKRGYAIVSINYRLSGEAIFPAQIHDVKAAIRWIKENAKCYSLEPNKIAAWGSSAGGYLAALAGTSSTTDVLDDGSMGNHSYNCGLQAVVVWFGPINFLKMDEQLADSGLLPQLGQNHSSKNSPESILLGGKLTDIPDQVILANPETYITKEIPPFFIQHGKKDGTVPFQQSVNFADLINRIGGEDKINLELIENAQHADPLFETEENIMKVFNFLDRILKPL